MKYVLEYQHRAFTFWLSFHVWAGSKMNQVTLPSPLLDEMFVLSVRVDQHSYHETTNLES